MPIKFVGEKSSNFFQSFWMSVRNFKSASKMISFEISGNNVWLITERKNTAPVKYDRGPLVNRSYVDEKNIYIY
jgi:hypothetical protein